LHQLNILREKVVIGDTPITLPNGSLSGETINQINSGEADIALSVTLQVPFRAKEVSFLLPTYYGKYADLILINIKSRAEKRILIAVLDLSQNSRVLPATSS